MTETQFRTILSLTRKAYASAKAEREAEVAADAEQGYRAHYCIHGTNQWTDYDNICGGCEDGQTLLNMVVNRVHHDVTQFHDRLDWLKSVPGGFLPREQAEPMWAWACETISRPEYQ